MAEESKEPEAQADPTLFAEFLSPQQQGMLQLHQMFTDMTAQGFTEPQALSLLGHMMSGLMGQQ